MASLKVKFEVKLHRTCRVDNVNLSEGWIARVLVGESQVGMIEEIEGFRTELHVEPVIEMKVALDAEVHVPVVGPRSLPSRIGAEPK